MSLSNNLLLFGKGEGFEAGVIKQKLNICNMATSYTYPLKVMLLFRIVDCIYKMLMCVIKQKLNICNTATFYTHPLKVMLFILNNGLYIGNVKSPLSRDYHFLLNA